MMGIQSSPELLDFSQKENSLLEKKTDHVCMRCRQPSGSCRL